MNDIRLVEPGVIELTVGKKKQEYKAVDPVEKPEIVHFSVWPVDKPVLTEVGNALEDLPKCVYGSCPDDSQSGQGWMKIGKYLPVTGKG